VAGASSPVLSTGYETKQNWEKHEGSLLFAFSDAGSTPAASTIIYLPKACISDVGFVNLSDRQ